MIGELASGLSIIDFFAKWFKKIPFSKKEPKETIAARFFQLFEAHGVHPNQIPTLIGHGLKIADVQSEEALLPKLDEELLNDVCELFAVRREWLDGADEQIYPLHNFNGYPELFGEFIDELKEKGEVLYGVVLAERNPSYEDNALIILEQTIGTVGDKPIYCYHLCNNWLFNDSTARAFLTACVAIAWKKKVYLHGKYVQQSLIEKYQYGKNFLEYYVDSSLPVEGKLWHPEDMAVKPDAFLDGLFDGEYHDANALGVWLILDERGLMEADLGYINVRESFEQKLEEITNS